MLHNLKVGETVRIGHHAELYSEFEKDYHGELVTIEKIYTDDRLKGRHADGEIIILHPSEVFYPQRERKQHTHGHGSL